MGFGALIVAIVIGVLVMRGFARDEAIDDARQLTRILAQGVIEPNLTPGVLAADPEALTAFDETVRTKVLRGSVVRVKLWQPDGSIIYSDESRLIGQNYSLGEEELDAIESGAVEAEASDLSKPENRYERSEGDLLEVYLPVDAPDGSRLLFETYLRADAINENSRRFLISLAPAMLIALALLQLVHLPLAWTMARRLERAAEERELLLERAIEASNAERRRIASDLHDGVVQDLAGIAMSLSGIADGAGRELPKDIEERLRGAASTTRREIRELRTLLVEIHPPNLHAVGLRAALQDLVDPLVARDVRATLDVAADLRLPDAIESLLFRAAHEGLRNVMDHAHATEVHTAIHVRSGMAILELRDNGTGFSPADRETKASEGHLGLRLLDALVGDAGGEMQLDSTPGKGTLLRVEVPLS